MKISKKAGTKTKKKSHGRPLDLSPPKDRIKRDWKNPQDYQDMQKFTVHQIAWEFLRRNPEYIKDWEKKIKKFKNKQKDKFIPCDPAKWGISRYLDPNKEYARSYFNLWIPLGEPSKIQGLVIGLGSFETSYVPDCQQGEFLFKFNFYQPVNLQINLAKVILKSTQDSLPDKSKLKRIFKFLMKILEHKKFLMKFFFGYQKFIF